MSNSNTYKRIVRILGQKAGLTSLEIKMACSSPSKWLRAYEQIGQNPKRYRVVLRDRGGYHILCIKQIRTVNYMGLKEAKELSETPGAVIIDCISHEKAIAIRDQFTAIGSYVDVEEVFQ